MHGASRPRQGHGEMAAGAPPHCDGFAGVDVDVGAVASGKEREAFSDPSERLCHIVHRPVKQRELGAEPVVNADGQRSG